MAFRPMRIDFADTGRSSINWPSFPTPRGNGLTTSQALNLAAILSQKGSGRSFWDRVKSGGGGLLASVLDKVMRSNYGVVAGVGRATAGDQAFDVGDFLTGFGRGFSGKEKRLFGELLDDSGLLKGHGRIRGVAGFGLDVGLDPLTYLSLAAAPVTGGGSLGYLLGKAGIRGAAEAGLRDKAYQVGSRFIDDAFHTLDPQEAARLLPDAERGLHSLQGLSEFGQRSALARKQVGYLKQVIEGNPRAVDAFDLDFARGAALEEQLSKTGKRLRVEAQLPFARKGLPITPGLLPIPKGVEKAVTATRLGSFLGKALVPGLENPEISRALLQGRHAGEQLANRYAEFASQQFDGVRGFSAEDQLNLLAQFEKDGVIKEIDEAGNVAYNLNPTKMAALSEPEQGFIRGWHNVMEHLRQADTEFGIHYSAAGEKGQLYVPHMMKRDDLGGIVRTRLNSVPGFQHARRGMSSVQELQALHAAGKIPKDIIADPMELMGRRLRTGANKQADTRVAHQLGQFGIPARKVDKAAVTAAEKELATATEARDAIGYMKPKQRKEHVQKLKDERMDELHDEFQQKLDKLRKEHSRIKFGRKTKTKAANLARKQKQIDALPAQFNAAKAEIEAGTERTLRGKIHQFETEQGGLRQSHTQANEAVKAAERGLSKAKKGVRHPDIEKAIAAGHVKVKDFNKYFPPDVAEALTRTIRVYQGDDEALNAIERTYRKWLANWKLLVTSVNPGYRARNTLSDFWNMYVAGVPTWAMVRYGAQASALMRHAKTGMTKIAKGETLSKKEHAAVAELTHAYNHGVLSGLFQGDIQQLKRYLEVGGSKRALAKGGHGLKLGEKVAQDFNRNAENWGRLTHYMYRRHHQKMGVARAAREVRMAHFDYEELTEFERRKAKAILPFYTWTRKNIPFQLKQLVSRPGKFGAFPKSAFEAEYSAGGGKGDLIPDYMSEQFAFKTPLGYLLPQIGAADLSVFNGQAKERVAGMVTPFAKIPIELLSGERFGTDIPINGNHDRAPVSGLAAAILSKLPGTNVGPTKRGDLEGVGANPRIGYFAGQVPFLNYLVNTSASIRKEQRNVAFGADIAYLAGLNFRELDQQEQLLIAQIDARDRASKMTRALRDREKLPEAKRSESNYDRLVAQIIQKNLGR